MKPKSNAFDLGKKKVRLRILKNTRKKKYKFITTDCVGNGEVWCYKQQRFCIIEKNLKSSRKQKSYN